VWDNYTFRARLNIHSGTILFNYRLSSEHGHYRYIIGINSQTLFLEKEVDGNFHELVRIRIIGTMARTFEKQWHEIEIRGYDSVINVLLDGKLYFAYKDKTPIGRGGISIESLGQSVCFIDDIEIRQTNMKDITSEPTPEQISGNSFVADTTHTGDLVIAGNETKVIENNPRISADDGARRGSHGACLYICWSQRSPGD